MAKKLLDRLREALRLKHSSYRTEDAYKLMAQLLYGSGLRTHVLQRSGLAVRSPLDP